MTKYKTGSGSLGLDVPPKLPRGWEPPPGIYNVHGDENLSFEWTITLADKYLRETSSFAAGPDKFENRPDSEPKGNDGVAGFYFPGRDEVWVTNRVGYHHNDFESILSEVHDIDVDGTDAVLFRYEFTDISNYDHERMVDILGFDPNGMDRSEIISELTEVIHGSIRSQNLISDMLDGLYIPTIDVPAMPFGATRVDMLQFNEITDSMLYKCIYPARMLDMPKSSLVGFRHQPRSKSTNPKFYQLSDLLKEIQFGGFNIPEPLFNRAIDTIVMDPNRIRGSAYEIL